MHLRIPLFTLFLLSLFFILLERIPIPGIGMSPYRILVGLMLFVTLIELIRNRTIYLPKWLIFFGLFLIGTSVIGLDFKNMSVFIQRIFVLIISIIIYNILVLSKIRESEYNKVAIILTIIAGIGGITLMTDYFGLTRISMLFGKEIYQEAQLLGRGSGILGGETNVSAARLSTILPFGFFLIFKRNIASGWKIFSLVMVGIVLISIILTGSRMGVLILGQILIFTAFHEIKQVRMIYKIAIIIGFVGLSTILYFSQGLILNQQKSELRFQSLGSLGELGTTTIKTSTLDGSLIERFLLLGIGIELIKNNPIMGVGIGNSKYLTKKYLPIEGKMKYLHNTYIELGAENGIPVLLIFLLMLTTILLKLIDKNAFQDDSFTFYFIIGFWSLLFCWLFLSDFSNKLFWNFYIPVSLYMMKRINFIDG